MAETQSSVVPAMPWTESCGLGNEIKGRIWGEGVWQKSEVENTNAMPEAYQAGCNAWWENGMAKESLKLIAQRKSEIMGACEIKKYFKR